ncbi:MAG: hypothetical protein RLY20_1647 [Verrucomicrobiota bacterium]|jgi:ABC-type Na+ efflux pump permease subunit
MTVLPIVERELRVAARQPGTYWVRTGVAAAVIGIGTIIFLNTQHGPPAEAGKAVFIALTIIAGLFCLMAGARATADCLSEEKRDGTLGLLFLTDLRGFDVVAGKLVAGSLNTFYGLLAVLPMLGLPLLMGGVSASEFWRIALVLLNTLFFSLASGMFASALTKSARNAAGLCMLIVLGIGALLPLIAVILASTYNLRTPPEALMIPSPGYAMVFAFDYNYPSHKGEFLLSLTLVHGLAWIFLVAACLIVPRSWQDKAATVTQLRWRDRWLRWSLGDSTQRAQFRARLLDVNAFHWLASRSRIKPALVWAVIGALACAWIYCWMKWKSDWAEWPVFVVTALILNTLIKGWFAGEACAQLSEDRRTGSLELLLSTPLGVHDIMRGQLLALARQFLWPLVFVVSVELAFLVAGLQTRNSENDVMVCMWICGLVVLFADLAALFYLALWLSLTVRSVNRANSGAVVRIMALPWVVYFVFMMMASIASWRSSSSMNGIVAVLIWTVISLLFSGFFGLRAKLKLETQFREVATKRYAPPLSIWKRFFGTTHSAQN